ncbi:hypothetical protein [Salinimicrobium flavum]|uniref:Uncharacterized protein n=1 Tax=Salinimicrobium flavum TaxID=1737065 RepID=A0ABW5IWX0_9FLAO
MKYIIIGIVAIIAIGFFISRTVKTNKASAEQVQLPGKTPQQNPYMEMRNMAFSTKAEQLGLPNIADDKVYGLITEMAMNPGSATVISFLTGDTSLYLSSGGGFIGAGQHEEVRQMLAQKVDRFQNYLSKARKIDEPSLPEEGTVNFNFLTKNGIYSVTQNMTDLESGKSEFSDLFKEVNEIITQIRLKSNG